MSGSKRKETAFFELVSPMMRFRLDVMAAGRLAVQLHA